MCVYVESHNNVKERSKKSHLKTNNMKWFCEVSEGSEREGAQKS